MRRLRPRQRRNPNLVCPRPAQHPRALTSSRAGGVNVVDQQHLASQRKLAGLNRKCALKIPSPASRTQLKLALGVAPPRQNVRHSRQSPRRIETAQLSDRRISQQLGLVVAALALLAWKQRDCEPRPVPRAASDLSVRIDSASIPPNSSATPAIRSYFSRWIISRSSF